MTAPKILRLTKTDGTSALDHVHEPLPTAPLVELISANTDSDPLDIDLHSELDITSIGRLAQAAAEVAFGLRPASHLHRWVARKPLEYLQAHGMAVRRHPSNLGHDGRRWQQVRGIRIQPVNPVTAETSAVLIGSRRSCAIAMRMELGLQRWLATDVRLA